MYCQVIMVNNIVPINKKMAIQSSQQNLNIEFFNDEELSQIFEYVNKKMANDPKRIKFHKRYLLLLETLLRTGARIQEVLALRPLDFNLNLNTVNLITLKKKKPAHRIIPLHPMLKDAIMTYFLEENINTKSTEKLFTMRPQAVDQYLKDIQRDLGFKVHAHKFRHTFAVKSIMVGTPLNVLQQWLGHSSIFTTSIYLNITGMDTSDFMKRMN